MRNNPIHETAFVIQGKYVIKDISRRMKHLYSYVTNPLVGEWGVGYEEKKKISRHIFNFIINYFYWKIADRSSDCLFFLPLAPRSTGPAPCRTARAQHTHNTGGAAGKSISIQKQGKQDTQQLEVLENAEAEHKDQQKLKSHIWTGASSSRIFLFGNPFAYIRAGEH